MSPARGGTADVVSPSASITPSAWSHRPALDGLRTVAVYLVVLFHAGLASFEGGFVGVDLFFVLSGFLVCNVVLAEVDRTGSLRIGHFYARRVRRLLPAAVVVIAVTSAVFVLVAPVVTRVPLIADARSALLYYSNWHFLAQSGDYFATDIDKSPFLHFWSLSIEEQYYAVFPLLVLLLVKLGRARSGWLLGVLGAFFALSLAAQVYWAAADASHAYYGTDARVYQLLAGALLAVVLRRWSPGGSSGSSAGPAAALAILGVLGTIAVGSGLLDISASVRGILATLTSVAALAGLSLAPAGLAGRVLATRVPVYLGLISYGIYLWHWPTVVVLTRLDVGPPPTVAVLTIVVSTVLAAASYHLLEMPVRSSRRLASFRWPSVVAGVGASALVAVTIVPATLASERRPLVTPDWPAAKLEPSGKPKPVPADFNWEEAENHGLLRTCGPDDPRKCTLVPGKGRHVLLLGDSQAQMLAPMFRRLAREHGFRLSGNIVAGCPWQEGLTNTKQSPENAQACRAARDDWYDEVLPELDPDVVIIVTRARDDEDEWGDSVGHRDGHEGSLRELTTWASRETMPTIASVADRVLLVKHLPMPETFKPNECLTSERDARVCAVPLPDSPPYSDRLAERLAKRHPEVRAVDLSPAFCVGKDRCEAMVDGMAVFRDDHHYATKWVKHRRNRVWRILTSAGLLTSPAG